MLERALDAGQSSVRRGPELLPVLREAGVVDAGGYGLTVHLRRRRRRAARHRGARARPPRARARHPPAARVLDVPLLHELRRHRRGARPVGAGSRRSRRSATPCSSSATSATLKVHVHTDEPERATALFAGAGDGLAARRRRHARAGRSSAPSGCAEPTAVLRRRRGRRRARGWRTLFASLGATPLPGGPTLNPSTYELLAGIHDVPAEEVVVLPNSPNVLMAAERAAELSEKKVVRRADALPAGRPGRRRRARPARGAAENGAAMLEALAPVRTGAVTERRARRRRGGRRASTAATPSASSTSGSSPGASRPRRSRSCSASWAARPSW